MQTKNCKQCNVEFKIFPKDIEFYKKMDVPHPTLCPPCREMRRMAFRNERSFYIDNCSICKSQIFSMHNPAKPYPVVCTDCWAGDKWGAETYARDYDFSRTFFDQFKELLQVVPRVATSTFGNENSSYINCASYDKNCYLIYGANYNEDVYYGNYVNGNKFCLDILFTHNSELCYECVDCEKCYNVKYARMSSGCIDSAFISDCKNCSNCFGCAGLRTKQYCLFNKQLSKEEYFKQIQQFDLNTREGVATAAAKAREVWDSMPVKYYFGENCQNVVGTSLFNSKDCNRCFESTELENCSYVAWLNKSKDCYDIFSWGFTAENCYECIEAGAGDNNLKFCRSCWPGCHSIEYSDYCKDSHDLFGCVGMRKKEYCILNKQYSPEEYKKLREKIVKHMGPIENGGTGEYGEFFPPALSQYGFNETKGIELYQVSKEEAVALGFRWQDNLPGTRGKEDVAKEILACACEICDGHKSAKCGMNFKIIKQELALYKRIGALVPLFCLNCRHMNRMRNKGTHTLYKRQCECENSAHDHATKCVASFETVYAPDRPEKIYCEECYKKEVA